MSEFKGQLGQYKIIPTEDDSLTLWSEYFDENCHSTHGAYGETVFNYTQACGVDTRVKGSVFNILEIGFGLGMGLKATIENASLCKESPIHFVSVELDKELIHWAIENIKIDGFDLSLLRFQNDRFHFQNDCIRIDILVGDARKTLAAWSSCQFHAIYQDAFSPKKNPTLWTVEWFELLKSLSTKDSIMATYCASVAVRKSMLEAGWFPESHKGYGHKRERTTATITRQGNGTLEKRLHASAAPALHD